MTLLQQLWELGALYLADSCCSKVTYIVEFEKDFSEKYPVLSTVHMQHWGKAYARSHLLPNQGVPQTHHVPAA